MRNQQAQAIRHALPLVFGSLVASPELLRSTVEPLAVEAGIRQGEKYDLVDLRIRLEHKIVDLLDERLYSPERMFQLHSLVGCIADAARSIDSSTLIKPTAIPIRVGWRFNKVDTTISVDRVSQDYVSGATIQEKWLARDASGLLQGTVHFISVGSPRLTLPVVDGTLRTHVHGTAIRTTELHPDWKNGRPTGSVDLSNGFKSLMIGGRCISTAEHPEFPGMQIPIVETRLPFTFVDRGLACASIVVRDVRRGDVELALVNDTVVRIQNDEAVRTGGQSFGYRIWEPAENHSSGRGWRIARQDSAKWWYVPCDYGL